MYYWTPKRIKELKAKGYKLREVPHDPGDKPTSQQADKPASEQAIEETVPHNDIEEANKPTSEQADKPASDQASSGSRINKRSI